MHIYMLPSEWIQEWTQTFKPNILKANKFIVPLGPFNSFTVIFVEKYAVRIMHFSVRSVFHGDRVLVSFNMVISGMKTTFYT